MTDTWSISPGSDRVELGPDGRAETTFTVTTNGPVDQRLVNVTVDLDEIILGGPPANNDLQYVQLGQSDGLITPLNGAQLAKISPTDRTAADCADAPLSSSQVQVSGWQPGEVLCVRTNAGRPSAILLDQKLIALRQPPPPPQLQVSITIFEP